MPLEYVTKRNNIQVPVDWSKVDGKLNYLNSKPTQLPCNASFVADRVREMDGENGMETKMFDERAIKVAEDFADRDPAFLELSLRIMVNNHHKNTLDCFSSTVEACYRNRKTVGRGNSTRSVPAPRVNMKFYKFVQLHKNRLNRIIDYDRDYRMTNFGYSTFIDRYALKRTGPSKKVIEARPQDYALERMQDMWLRVACAIHMNRDDLADESVLDAVEETYDLLSLGYIMHATPTLYNAGTPSEQLLSCYLVGGTDSIEGISKLEGNCKKLSKYSGGIGFWWPLRSSGSSVDGINGTSDGPEPFLRCMEASMKAVNQGGKRPGSAANYEQPAHPDVMRWLELKRENASNSIPNLFYALWIHDEFMHRVVRDEMWYFVDPAEHPQLYDMLGEEYSREYRRIIEAGEYKGEPIKARKLLMEACITQAEAGMPYMLFADACNQKSNMKNTMVTRCSNLCSEILIPSSADEYGCCAISSLCLQRFVIDCDCCETETKWIPGHVEGHQQGCNGRKRVDYENLAYCAGVLVRNLNRITDINFYPVEEARRSQMRHRPLAIGVMGLADLFHVLRYPFTGAAARAENKRIFESIYYGGVRASMELAREHGMYETFLGDPLNNPKNPAQPCPAAEGKLQFDLWGLTEKDLMGRWDWTALKGQVKEHGLRNSFITALPPTASTSQLQGCNEAFEPYTDNIYVRKTLTGENIVINHHLVKDLQELGLWSPTMRNQLVVDRGSVQNLALPEHALWIKEQYKTVWEMDNRDLIDMDAERGPFVDQTQSSNRFIRAPTAKKLFAMHIRAWRKGLKTGNYYIRSLSESKPTQFSEGVKVQATKANDPLTQEEVKTEDKTVEQEMICMLKKKNGVMCYTCQ
jgi:ribonucleoside-diphosphate reductase alpha subunit